MAEGVGLSIEPWNRRFGSRTEVSASTLFNANSELAKLSSGQTDKSQKVAIGALNQESTATNAASVVEGIVGAAVRAAVGK